MGSDKIRELSDYYHGKKILVTGSAGSIGSQMVSKLIEMKPEVIRILDNNETGLFELEQRFGSEMIRPLVGDVRDIERIRRAVEDVDLVFHAAALKHVPLCEYNPFEAVKTNVYGTQNVIDACLDEEIEKFILISTDKAVNPVNVMGATKLLAERLTTSANLYKGRRRTAFSVVRFGNVLNSRGSILHVLKEQIKNGGPVTLTDEEMTRFIMSIDSAVELVLRAAYHAAGGEVFILKMPSLRIPDLVDVVIEELAPRYGYRPEDIEVEITERRRGEKLFEELMTSEEKLRSRETEDMYIIKDGFSNSNSIDYNSKNSEKLEKEDIKRILREIKYIS